MTVNCPIEGCGYAGELSSVEAHISGSTQGEHEGEAGREHREDLAEEAEVAATEEATEEASEREGSDPHPEIEEGEKASPPQAAGAAAAAAPVAGLSFLSGSGNGSNARLIGVALLGLLVLWLLLAQQDEGSSEGSEASTEPSSEPSQQNREVGGLQ